MNLNLHTSKLLLACLVLVPLTGFSQNDNPYKGKGYPPLRYYKNGSLILLNDTTDRKEDSIRTKTDCICPAIPEPGKEVPEYFPYSKYMNDSTMWHWVEGPFPGTKVYDLKPEYTDTIIRNDGSVIDVPIWIKDPNWKKPEKAL